MTVGELVRLLRRFDSGAEVYIETRECLDGSKEEPVTVRALTKAESERDGNLCHPAIVIE